MSDSISYWDADKESMVSHEGVIVCSSAGWGPGPEYGVLYLLDSGRFLGGVRHDDRGALMTEVSYSSSAKDACPKRLLGRLDRKALAAAEQRRADRIRQRAIDDGTYEGDGR